jgi:hypothetical protein
LCALGPEDATCHKAENQLVMHVNPKGWDQRYALDELERDLRQNV